jgi:S-adenosyl-L-methionine hydrolase (adenosine-forming)
MHIITLLTDFGLNNAYVAQMKGVIASIAPMTTCIDITHTISPQQVKIGSFLLSSSIDFFPKGTIHVAIVDPGVGTKRRGIVVVTSKQVFVGPDNGLLIAAAKKQGHFDVYEITNDALFNETISQTFHGRDIFAPIAAHIARGVSFEHIGRKINDYHILESTRPRIHGQIVEADVEFIDDFGNIITNLDTITFHSFIRFEQSCVIKIKRKKIIVPYVTSYGHRPQQELLLTNGSSGFIELAINQGNAAMTLGMSIGDTITFDFTSKNHIDDKKTEDQKEENSVKPPLEFKDSI